MTRIFTLFLALIATTNCFAQIPNGSFENWDSVGSYVVPQQWDNLNAYTTSTSTYTCMKGVPGMADSFYLKLVSKDIPGHATQPGIAVSGVLDTITLSAKSGFAYNQRPQQLQGDWQYMAWGNDQGYISVLLSKWNIVANKRDTIAMTKYDLPSMVMTWAPFGITLNYMNSANPDTCIIVLSASGHAAVNQSYLYVDNLAFGDSATSIKETPTAIKLNVYPNPASENLHISYSLPNLVELKIGLFDITGRIVKQDIIPATNAKTEYDLNLNGIAKGIYILKLDDGSTTAIRKICVE